MYIPGSVEMALQTLQGILFGDFTGNGASDLYLWFAHPAATVKEVRLPVLA
jgi:hypothetical protein